ncbi:MAG TPA: hypothetical protein VIL63_08265 [Terriglobales bacterium]
MSGASPDDVRLSHGVHEFRAECLNPDIELRVEWAETLRAWPGERVFDSGALWQVFREDGYLVFDFTSPVLSFHPYKRLRVDRDFRSGEVVLSREALDKHRPICPLEYPTDELLVTNYLASGLGVEVHGCGLTDVDAGGQLFLGHSGAGKSTTAMLWKSLRGPEILSDDRVILRLHDGELWMYGTPWHGEAAFASAGRAKLERIFILEHGEGNRMRMLPKAHAVGELFARCFPPFHSPAGLENTLQFLSRVANTVPCYEFHFVPDGTAVQVAAEFNG